MGEEADITVLQRMAGSRRAAPVLSAMTVQKALRLAAARAGDEALGCVVGLRDLAEARGMPEQLAETLPAPGLVMQLAGPGRAQALAVACPQVVGAVIEAQTVGRVLAAAAPDRAPTRTDGVMLAGFLDMLLAGFAVLGADCPDPPPVAGLAYAGPLADLRAGVMVLPDAEHLHYAIGLDFAKGAKTGALHLLLPVAQAGGRATARAQDWQGRLRQAVLGSSARIEAILCRERLPLARITRLAVGDVLELSSADLADVTLTGLDGKVLIRARLGRSGGMRALRVTMEDGGGLQPQRAPPRIAEPSGAEP